ncbi:MAG: helix-turn-helix domain-containing protein [Saprospiraceae bacterium]
MDLNYNFLNITILFGAIQGFVLCVAIYNRKETNQASVLMFVLFLFSLAFLNLMYAFLDMDLFQYYRPLHVFPYPYKWLIGPAFYFYIKNKLRPSNEQAFHRKEWYLFIPALMYGCLRLYWFIIAASENSYRLIQVVVDSNFFRIQEVIYLLYTISLGLLALRFLGKHTSNFRPQPKVLQNMAWLKGFIRVFITIHFLGFLLFSIDLILHNGQETFQFSYPNLIINVAFIYWIGIVGFTKPKLLFSVFRLENTNKKDVLKKVIRDRLDEALRLEEVYKNPNITLEQLALSLEISPRELSRYINEVHQKNFSELLNFHRIKKVKELLAAPESKKYTILALAEEAGFSSKSSFNAIFKKMVGVTPSVYQKQQFQKQ